MLINCGNYYNEQSLNEVCVALEKGETVEVHIDCIGHIRNNNEQEAYKEILTNKYGNALTVIRHEGYAMYSYEYVLNRGLIE